MRRRKSNNKVIVVLLTLVICAAGLLGGMVWFVSSHFFVNGKAYAYDAKTLDLRNQIISVADYEAIRKKLPESTIRWNIPFQNSAYPDDTVSLTLGSLSDADLDVLSYFKNLAQVDASGCRDYVQLQKLREQYPNVRLTYTVTIGGQDYAQDASAVTCSDLTDEDIGKRYQNFSPVNHMNR